MISIISEMFRTLHTKQEILPQNRNRDSIYKQWGQCF